MIRKRDEVDTNSSVKWRWIIVPKRVEQIDDFSFIETYKSNKIQIGMIVMWVNDSEMSMRW